MEESELSVAHELPDGRHLEMNWGIAEEPWGVDDDAESLVLNGLDRIINTLINRKQKQITFTLIYPVKEYQERKTFIPLTYFGPISDKIS